MAVTHNFVDRHNIMSVWRDLEKSAKTDDDYDDLLRIWKEKLEVIFIIIIFFCFWS